MNAKSQRIGPLRRSTFCHLVLSGSLACALLMLVLSMTVETAAAPQAGATQNQLTVQRIYSAPSLSGRTLRDTVWSPDGKLLTYLDDNAAGPEIWAPCQLSPAGANPNTPTITSGPTPERCK